MDVDAFNLAVDISTDVISLNNHFYFLPRFVASCAKMAQTTSTNNQIIVHGRLHFSILKYI